MERLKKNKEIAWPNSYALIGRERDGKMLEEKEFYFESVEREWIDKEKRQARELRRSQWWKNQLGRGRCYYCEQSVHPHDLTMDHVVPLVRGGRTTRSNVVPCCKGCNTAKQNLVPCEWRQYLERLKNKTGKK